LEKSEIAIIIPCFNEEKTINTVVKNASYYGIPIIVDDKSTDKSIENLNQIQSEIIVKSNDNNIGYEKTLQVGFEIAQKSGFKYAITLDADNQFDHKDIGKLIKKSSNFDIVIAQRSKLQRLAENFFSIIFNFFFKIRDPLSGLKFYRMDLFLENKEVFDSKNLIGTELLCYSIKKRKKISTIEVETAERKDKPRYGGGFKANIKIFIGLFGALKTIYS
tara:strand:- start:896 stop:1552 length:657 start_codon:yes stop_codon:yes gene_type:complete